MHPDLSLVQKLVYEPNGWVISQFSSEKGGKEYAASSFLLNRKRVVFRVAKTTPKKKGQFVTLWKRVGTGPILPYHQEDPFDLFVISVRSANRLGQFVFPKKILCDKNVVATEDNEGKRAIRVYPPWEDVESQQAKRTQLWQSVYFFEVGVALSVNQLYSS